MNDNAGKRDAGAALRRLIAMDKSTLPPDGGERFNRLIFATSPYLLQHAENPVDWYQWGEEAFGKARAEDRPLFLSIGYATCHWCHVMEHESFEDREVADVLNRHFVAIKVDREERPDIDDQYMAVAQMMTGSGGWPLQVIMTPDRQPFYTFTYLPKRGRGGMPGLIELLENIAQFWRTRRDDVLRNCAAVLKSLGQLSASSPGKLAGTELAEGAFAQLDQMYDPVYGGFGGAPKFPMPHYVSFLLRHWRRTGLSSALRMADHTLRMMRRGGVCDQLGFGFHRYAVDREWLVPHFEKMLYDQALIALAFGEAFQASGDRFYRQCAEEIFTYLLREMASPEGGFYSGEDADTEGEEGKYYVWTPDEVKEMLKEDTARLFCRLYDVTPPGNFEGRNILHLPVPPEEFARREEIAPEFLAAEMERARELLLKKREERIRPLRDEKVLAAWNGLAIAALARCGAAFGDDRWLSAAQRAASFVREKLVAPDGRLMRSHHLGRATIPAFLEDYAFYAWGLIELYEATLDAALLDEARRLCGEMLRLFVAPGRDGLFEIGADAEQLPVRSRSVYDGVIPSGNSAAAMDFLKLGRMLDDDSLAGEGEAVVRAFMGKVGQQPAGYLNLVMAHAFLLGPAVEITLVGPAGGEEIRQLLRAVKGRFIPDLVLRHGGEGELEGLRMLDGRPTAYVCAKGACRPPVASVAELERLLDEVG